MIYEQEFIQVLLIMSVLYNKIEFYKGESDCEVIVIAAGIWGYVRQTGFSIMGEREGEDPLPYESNNVQSATIKSQSLPTKFFPLPVT